MIKKEAIESSHRSDCELTTITTMTTITIVRARQLAKLDRQLAVCVIYVTSFIRSVGFNQTTFGLLVHSKHMQTSLRKCGFFELSNESSKSSPLCTP